MGKYRKLPVVIDAWKVTEEMSNDELIKVSGMEEKDYFLGPNGFAIRCDGGDIYIGTGEWLIKGVEGEFYPCSDSIFIKTYIEA